MIPSLMFTVSLLAPTRIDRTTNVLVSLLYTVPLIMSIRGEIWFYVNSGAS